MHWIESIETVANLDKLPTSIIGTLADAGGNLSAPSAPANWLPAQWQSSVAQAWVGADIITWEIAQDANNWYAEHTASTSIVVPYFDGALLVRNNLGVVTVCGQFGAPALTNNGLNRFWTYTLSKTGLATCGGLGTYQVVGLKGSAALVNLPGV